MRVRTRTFACQKFWFASPECLKERLHGGIFRARWLLRYSLFLFFLMGISFLCALVVAIFLKGPLKTHFSVRPTSASLNTRSCGRSFLGLSGMCVWGGGGNARVLILEVSQKHYAHVGLLRPHLLRLCFFVLLTCGKSSSK